MSGYSSSRVRAVLSVAVPRSLPAGPFPTTTTGTAAARPAGWECPHARIRVTAAVGAAWCDHGCRMSHFYDNDGAGAQ